jgi:hypothetical protein
MRRVCSPLAAEAPSARNANARPFTQPRQGSGENLLAPLIVQLYILLKHQLPQNRPFFLAALSVRAGKAVENDGRRNFKVWAIPGSTCQCGAFLYDLAFASSAVVSNAHKFILQPTQPRFVPWRRCRRQLAMR